LWFCWIVTYAQSKRVEEKVYVLVGILVMYVFGEKLLTAETSN
jgi:hypothetical protein